jgi:molecular chaperone DnaK
LIEKNTTIPTSKSQVFSTAADNQPSVEIHVIQGERSMAQDNKSLGRFILDGIPPAPRGVPQIEVTFDVDANGILKVTAKDKGTGKEQHITITGSSGMSDAEIEQMQKEAEQYAEEDKKKKEKIEVINQADSTVFQTEKLLKENEDKIPDDVKQSVQPKLDEIKKILEDKENLDHENLKTKLEELNQEVQKIGSAMYQDQTPPPGAESQEDDGTRVKNNNQADVEGEVVEEDE